jgi:hypothetical protein
MKRSAALGKLYIDLHDTEHAKTTAHLDDLVRAAIILAVAAMDAYFTDMFCELLVPYLKKSRPGKGMVTLLKEAGLDTEQALLMLPMRRPYRRVHALVQAFLSRKVTQRFEAIDGLFVCYGVTHLSKRVESKLGRKRLLGSIRILVKRRHAIVHQGDLTRGGKLAPIDARTVRRLGEIVRFVQGAEELLMKAVKA